MSWIAAGSLGQSRAHTEHLNPSTFLVYTWRSKYLVLEPYSNLFSVSKGKIGCGTIFWPFIPFSNQPPSPIQLRPAGEQASP
jgi:hypothetical protein